MANQHKTPLLRPLRKMGATLYTFPSAAEDIALNITGGTQGVSMSHFALLNFTNENFDLQTPEDIAISLQNYAMNMETVIINQESYNYQEPYTVSEHVFWHWVSKHYPTPKVSDYDGARTSLFERLKNTNEVSSDVITDNNIYKEYPVKFTSGNESVNKDNRLVQMFAAIDAGNHLSNEFGMYNEIYVNIPTSFGSGPVYFRKVTDNINYLPGHIYNGTNSVSIEGRSNLETVNYLNDLKPQYDEALGYKDTEAWELIKDMATIKTAIKRDYPECLSTYESYDDVNIDSDHCKAITDDYGYEFKFNAILLYYSLYNLNDINKEPVATNLFGIVFLDGGANSMNNSGYTLAPMIKRKSYNSNDSTKNSFFGNSYSFRVNIKTLSVYDDTEGFISDNTTTTSAYAQDFNDVLANLNRAIDIMNTNVHTTSKIQDQYMTMLANYTNILNEISTIKENCINAAKEAIKNEIEELKKLGDTYDTYMQRLEEFKSNFEKDYPQINSGYTSDSLSLFEDDAEE